MHASSKYRKLNMNSALRRQVLRNLTTDLIKYGRIETTVPKAKELRRLVDKMITLGKRGTECDRRRIEAYLYQPKTVVPLLMGTYAKRFADRPGGFTRLINIGHRKGDYAPMAMIEILNTENPEAEVSFNYLVKSLANMQLKEETKIVEKALSPAIDSNAVFADKRSIKKALEEQKSKEKFALKIAKAMKNARMSAERLQEIVDENVEKVQEFQDAEADGKINRYVKELWPENTPALR
ncbi:54S ribosomal protein L8, mitochondrial [Coemansia sp. RSA 1933]|nr:54S ribosomal protein L8, mitochondrial [Coemansia sp. RSA 1933]